MERRNSSVKRLALFAGTLVSVLLIISAANARLTAQSGDDDVIRACTRQVGVRKEITMMVIADSCEPGWTLVQWNVQGPPGDPGKDGEKGDVGPPGAPGDSHWGISGSSTFYSNGNVGIKTTSPNTLLHINGTGIDNNGSTAVVRIVSGNGAQNLLLDGNEIDATADGLFLNNNTRQNVVLVANGGNVGVGTANPSYRLDVAGSAHASGFPTSSDARLKTDVEQLTNVLEKLEEVRGVSFEWNEAYESLGRSTGHREIGVIAQEVEAVFPELVTTWGDKSYRAVDYGRLTGVLIEAVKELNADKEAEIATLQQQNADLEARVAALEALVAELAQPDSGRE